MISCQSECQGRAPGAVPGIVCQGTLLGTGPNPVRDSTNPVRKRHVHPALDGPTRTSSEAPLGGNNVFEYWPLTESENRKVNRQILDQIETLRQKLIFSDRFVLETASQAAMKKNQFGLCRFPANCQYFQPISSVGL